jgi:hypothetical protein
MKNEKCDVFGVQSFSFRDGSKAKALDSIEIVFGVQSFSFRDGSKAKALDSIL